VTGYATDWTGEAEIGAWEIASGCRDLIAAWLLNLYAMWIGLWVSPRAVWRAFARGRHSRNLYAEPWSEALLDESVGSMRHRLALESGTPCASLSDQLRFAGWSAAAVALATATGASAVAARVGDRRLGLVTQRRDPCRIRASTSRSRTRSLTSCSSGPRPTTR
jgi:hypothetical protein